jgi:hypothetical protein
MISLRLAARLRDAGLRWRPARGDRFVLPDRDMDDDVFVLSDLSVELHEISDGTLLGFNGTVEWALDSVDLTDALWLPSEEQLRAGLGGTFQSLERVDERFSVATRIGGHEIRVQHAIVAEAYGLALLHLITGEPIDQPG